MASEVMLERYHYIRDLGRGGMSHVVLAEDTLLGRRVALKRMNASDDTRALLRLRREALVGASVSHPNLVSIYDIVAAGGGEYVIVMEYVEGETLRDALARDARPPIARALTILDGAAAGLDAIHDEGIVHRDVKPANILLATNGGVKLADLGIASAPDRTRITTEGAILGTLSYIAPEQLEGKSVGPATDVYSLAAVAYETLSGLKARSESNAVALAHAIVSRPPPDLRNAWREAPPDVAKVLIGAMAADPAVRPRSAGDLVRRLRVAFELPATAPVDRRSTVPPPARGRTGGSRTELARASRAAAARRAAARSRVASPVAAKAARRQGRGEAVTKPPEPPPEPVSDGRARARRGPVAALAGGLVLVAALAVALAAGGSDNRRAQTKLQRSPGQPPKSRGARSVTPTSRVAANQHTAAAGSGVPRAAAAAPAPTPPVNSPVRAAESFYSLAAAHRYPQAWALADPTFRSQLGGYRSFEHGQALDRSITFDSARVVNQTADRAMIAVKTTSVRANGTQHCAGSIDLRLTGSAWLLHLISINCA